MKRGQLSWACMGGGGERMDVGGGRCDQAEETKELRVIKHGVDLTITFQVGDL